VRTSFLESPLISMDALQESGEHESVKVEKVTRSSEPTTLGSLCRFFARITSFGPSDLPRFDSPQWISRTADQTRRKSNKNNVMVRVGLSSVVESFLRRCDAGSSLRGLRHRTVRLVVANHLLFISVLCYTQFTTLLKIQTALYCKL
jgi:hypothetical protein